VELDRRIRALASRHGGYTEALAGMVAHARDNLLDVILGYENWGAYLADALAPVAKALAVTDRRQMVEYLASQGLSSREIAQQTGVSKSTVNYDLHGRQLATSGQLAIDTEDVVAALWIDEKFLDTIRKTITDINRDRSGDDSKPSRKPLKKPPMATDREILLYNLKEMAEAAWKLVPLAADSLPEVEPILAHIRDALAAILENPILKRTQAEIDRNANCARSKYKPQNLPNTTNADRPESAGTVLKPSNPIERRVLSWLAGK
jgi:DNA-binding CsgD family transcriptional regulator